MGGGKGEINNQGNLLLSPAAVDRGIGEKEGGNEEGGPERQNKREEGKGKKRGRGSLQNPSCLSESWAPRPPSPEAALHDDGHAPSWATVPMIQPVEQSREED